MLQKLLSLLLSLLLALGPAAPAFAAEPLQARLAAAREALKSHFSKGTLVRVDYAELEKEYQALPAPVATEVKAAWDTFLPPARRYNELRRDLLALSNDATAVTLRVLYKDLGLPPDKEESLLLRYAQIKATLLEHGVKGVGGVFLDHEEKPLSEEKLANILAKAPVLSDSQQASAASDLVALSGVKDAIGKKDYGAAVKQLNKVLENMGEHPELVTTGFGSLPMQTALALIQETRKELPTEFRKQVPTAVLDQQLLALMKQKIEVPDIPGKEFTPDEQGETPLVVGVQLSFYAALTGFPLVSGWAAKRLYQISGTDALRADPNVKSFRFADRDPSGAIKPGFYITYKTGETVYNGRDGAVVKWNPERTARIEENLAAGSYRLVELKGGEEKEIVSWKRDADGIRRGKFLGRPFELGKNELAEISKGKGPGGKETTVLKINDGLAVVRWMDSEGQRGKFYPKGLGQWVAHKTAGADGKDSWYRDIILEPEALKKAGDGALDLSPLKGDLDEAIIQKFQRFLNDLPHFGLLFAHSLKGGSATDDKGVTTTNTVMDALIRDGRLTLTLGAQRDTAAKKGEMKAGYTIAAEVESDGRLKVFLFSRNTTFMWVFDAAQNACDQFLPDSEAAGEGNSAFIFNRRYERKGAEWVMTQNKPLQIKEWTTGDTLLALGKGALHGLGTAGEVVFSPFQSAHHVVHSGLVSGMGHLAGVGHFAAFDGVYTRRQATFAKWAGAGLETPDQIMAAYNSGLSSAGSKENQREINMFLDTKVEEFRKERWGELYRFHKEDPIKEEDRAYAAARVFGLSNLAGVYFDAGKESFAKGNSFAGVGNYAVGAFAAGGQMYVQGFGFGAVANGVKSAAVGARFGMKAEQVALAVQRSALIERGAVGVTALTKIEAAAVSMLKGINRAEMALFVTPGAAAVGESVVGGLDAWRKGDTKSALGHLDNFIAGAAMFIVPMGLSRGAQFANNLAVKAAQLRSTDPKAVEKLKQDLISEVKKDSPEAAKEVAAKFSTDSMTGMNNRSWLMENATQLLAKLEKPFVAILDMNNFGAVNEGLVAMYGPSVGKTMADTMLFKAAQRLKGLAEQCGVEIARFGGEEFAVLGEQAAVVKFTEAAKLEFANNQALHDVGYGEGSKEYTAIKKAAAAKGRGDHSIGDWTYGIAGAKGRTFNDAWHAADAALGAGKQVKGGRGNAFIETLGPDGKPKYEKVESALEGEALLAAQREKALRDADLPTLTQVDVEVEMAALRQKLGQEKFEKFEKAANIDSLTQTREYDFIKSKALEWGEKYKNGGEAALISARGLKLINDALGHEAGDRFLKAFGRELRKAGLNAREKGNWMEETTRVASKDFLIVGPKTGGVVKAVEAAMKKVMASSEVLSTSDRAKLSELAKSRNESAAEAGTLRVVESPLVQDAANGRADIFKTLDGLIEKADNLKKQEQPAPPPPPKVNAQ